MTDTNDIVERLKQLLDDWIKTDGEDAPECDLKTLEDSICFIEQQEKLKQGYYDEAAEGWEKYRELETEVLTLFNLQVDCHRYTWPFHSIRYKTLTECLKAKKEELYNG